MLLLVDANLTDQPFSFGLAGKFTDFNTEWFNSIGKTIRDTMWFNAIYPLIEFVAFYLIRLLFRLIDSSCTLDKYRTKSKSIQGYLDIQSGPLYLMHFKYAAVLNIVFVTFMYGYGIPELFPIALVSFIIILFVEKAQLYYSYRAPPLYDERLSQKVLSIM